MPSDYKILVSSDSNGYFEEQLLIEGLGGIFISRPGLIDTGGYNLIIICRGQVTAEEAGILKEYVHSGGTAILINPCMTLQNEFNWQMGETIPNAYLSDCSIEGFTSKILQIYSIKKYHAPQTLAYASYGRDNNTRCSAIYEERIVRGKLITLNFDFLETIRLLTHGRNTLSDEISSGITKAGYRTIIDKNLLHIPQADILRQLLIRIIEDNCGFPLPRIWYFPNTLRNAIVLSHDSDNVTSRQLEEVTDMNLSNKIDATVFMRLTEGNPFIWRKLLAKKQTLQLHPLYLYHPAPSKFLSTLQKKLISTLPVKLLFAKLFVLQKIALEILTFTKVKGVRSHGLFWIGKLNAAFLMSKLGIEFDSTLGSSTDYGYVFGTGMPFFLRNADYKNSGILEIPLHIMDAALKDTSQKNNIFYNASDVIKQFIDNAINYCSFAVFDFHHYFLTNSSRKYNNSQLYSEITKYAAEKNTPCLSMEKINIFWRKRLKTYFTELSWETSSGMLSFRTVKPEGFSPVFLLPESFNGIKNNQKSKFCFKFYKRNYLLLDISGEGTAACIQYIKN